MKYILYFNILVLIIFSETLYLFSASAAQKELKTTDDYQLYLKSGHRSSKWDEFIEPAFESFDSGNLPTAFIFMDRAYANGCRDGLLLFRLGLFRESRGEYKEAADLLNEAAQKIAKQYPSHALAKAIHEHAARALFKIDAFDHALPEIKKGLEADPKNFILLFMGGQILRIKKQFPEAREMFERALKATPPVSAPNALFRILSELMVLSFDSGDLDAADSYADHILSIVPNDPAALTLKKKITRQRHLKKERDVIEQIVK